jgi:hypothetical protein
MIYDDIEIMVANDIEGFVKSLNTLIPTDSGFTLSLQHTYDYDRPTFFEVVLHTVVINIRFEEETLMFTPMPIREFERRIGDIVIAKGVHQPFSLKDLQHFKGMDAAYRYLVFFFRTLPEWAPEVHDKYLEKKKENV